MAVTVSLNCVKGSSKPRGNGGRKLALVISIAEHREIAMNSAEYFDRTLAHMIRSRDDP